MVGTVIRDRFLIVTENDDRGDNAENEKEEEESINEVKSEISFTFRVNLFLSGKMETDVRNEQTNESQSNKNEIEQVRVEGIEETNISATITVQASISRSSVIEVFLIFNSLFPIEFEVLHKIS